MSQLCRAVRIVGYLKQTQRFYAACRAQCYYEILGVKTDASKEDIRAAFLNLSKQVHPDTGNKNGHADFVKITEAYNILSKDYTRLEYDAKLNYARNYHHHSSYHPHHRTVYHNRSSRFEEWRDTQRRGKEARSDDNCYEAIGPNRFTNTSIVLLCLLTSAIGISLQIFAIVRSPTLDRSQMLDRSEMYSAELQKIQDKVKNHETISKSIDIFLDKVTHPDDK